MTPSPTRLFVRIGLVLLIAGGATACAEKARKTLDPSDEELLLQLKELAEIRILAQEHPDRAQARLDSFLAHTDTTGIRRHIAQIERDPNRGRLLLKALHDSLLAPLKHRRTTRPAGGGNAQVPGHSPPSARPGGGSSSPP